MTLPSIGFIGLGLMGRAMVDCLHSLAGVQADGLVLGVPGAGSRGPVEQGC